MQKVILIMLMLFLISCENVTSGSSDCLKREKIGKVVISYLEFENFWTGKWSKRGYWKDDIFAKMKRKDSVSLTLSFDDKMNYVLVFIDELRTVIYVDETNDDFFVVSADDSWWKEKDKEAYLEFKKDKLHKNKSIEFIYSFNKSNQKESVVISKEIITTIVKAAMCNKKRNAFIKGNKITKNKEVVYRFGIPTNGYNSMYGYLVDSGYIAQITYSFDDWHVLASDFFHWQDLPDKRHYENIIKQINLKYVEVKCNCN